MARPSTDPIEKSGSASPSPVLTIQGMVRSGCGRATQAFTEQRCEELRMLFGWRPYPGTLNLSVKELDLLISRLGPPDEQTEHETRIGPLRWWQASLAIMGKRLPVLIVRGLKSRTTYLEVAAPIKLRELGLADGRTVLLTRGRP